MAVCFRVYALQMQTKVSRIPHEGHTHTYICTSTNTCCCAGLLWAPLALTAGGDWCYCVVLCVTSRVTAKQWRQPHTVVSADQTALVVQPCSLMNTTVADTGRMRFVQGGSYPHVLSQQARLLCDSTTGVRMWVMLVVVVVVSQQPAVAIALCYRPSLVWLYYPHLTCTEYLHITDVWCETNGPSRLSEKNLAGLGWHLSVGELSSCCQKHTKHAAL